MGATPKGPCSLRGSGEKSPGSSVIVAALCMQSAVVPSPVELKIDIKDTRNRPDEFGFEVAVSDCFAWLMLSA